MTTSTKECSHHKEKRKRFLRGLFAFLLAFLFIILLTILLIWAILQPKKPRFIIQDATVYALTVNSNPNLINSTIQVTISSRNRNDKIGVYYDRLHVYATYRSQQITYYTAIPSVYQGHKDVNVWSPFVSGMNVPVAPYNEVALSQDKSNGAVWLMIKLDGRVRWKVGSFISGRYHLHVTCPAYIPFGNANAVKFQLSQSCKVSV